LIEYAKAQINEHPELSADDLYAKLLVHFGSRPSLLRAAAGASIAADPGLLFGLVVAALLWPIVILRDAVTARRRKRTRAEVEVAVRLAAPDRCIDWSPPKAKAHIRRGPEWLGWVLFGLIAWGVLVLMFLGVVVLFVS
jgi:hypothetical protein